MPGRIIVFGAARLRGVGMLEFLVALLIFSTGMAGLLSVQLEGKKAAHRAAQRLIATHLGRDILERMQANPVEIEAYRATNVGDSAARLPDPALDCSSASCNTAQLAGFDLWQWESALLGESEQYADGNAGGLVAPSACIRTEGGLATVSISWRDVTAITLSSEAVCEIDGEVAQSPQLHQLTLSTFIATR